MIHYYLLIQRFHTLFKKDLGVYVSINGCRSHVEKIMWASRPISVTFMNPYLLCFCERGVDVFHVKTSSALYAEYEVPKVAEGFCRVDCGLKVGFNDFK